MKLTSIIFATLAVAANAFGPVSQTSITQKATTANTALVNGLRNKAPATTSSLFRDNSVTRGGAVPGWAAYNEALDKTPITAKALTSCVGFFLGDLLAQVRIDIY